MATRLVIDCTAKTEEYVTLTPAEVEAKEAEAVILAESEQALQQLLSIVEDAPALFEASNPEWYSWSPQQMEQYVKDNVKDFASAVLVLRKMAFAIGVLADRAFPGRR